VPEERRAAAFFDLDKTIIAKSSTLAFGKPFFQGGLLNRRAVLRSAYAQFVFALAGADEDQMDRMRSYLASMCAGWDVQQVRDIVDETLHTVIDPWSTPRQSSSSRRTTKRDVRCTSCPPPARKSSSRSPRCSVPTRHRDDDGRAGRPYTGEIEFAAGRRRPRPSSASRMGTAMTWPSCYAYSDSITDLPMLEAVGHPAGQPRPRPAQGGDPARLAGAALLQRHPAA
jgi:phosphoserine phosphatase